MSCVKKCYCPIVYSEIPLGRDSFSCGDRSTGKQCGLIDWFLYGAPYSIEGFLKNLSKLFINNLCVKICNSSNAAHTSHQRERNPIKRTSIYDILQLFNTLFLCFVILFRICLTKFESIKLKCYFTTLLYTIAVNMLFIEFSTKKGFSLNYIFDVS